MGLPLRSVGYTAALFASLALPATAAEKNDSDFECEKGCADIYERQISSGFNDEAAGRNVLACMQACHDDVAEDAGGWISYCDSLGRGVKDKERIPKRLQPLHDLLTYLEDESGAFRYLGLTCLNIEPRRSADRAYDKGETLVEALVVARQTVIPTSYDEARGSGFPFNQRLPLVTVFPENDVIGKIMENAHYGTVAFLNPKLYPIPELVLPDELPPELRGAIMLGDVTTEQLPQKPKKKKGGVIKAFVRGMNPFRQDKPRRQIASTIPDPLEVIYRPIGMEESPVAIGENYE